MKTQSEQDSALGPDADLTSPWRLLEASAWVRCGLAVLLVALALGLQYLLGPTVSLIAFLLLYPAVFLSAWFGGPRAGVLATVLSAFGADFLFMSNPGSLLMNDPGDYLRLTIFVSMGLLFSGVVARHQEVMKAALEAKARAERSEELVRTIAENSTLGLAMMDARGFCTYANKAWLEMTGNSAEEMRARPLHDIVHHHRPDGRPYPMEECPIDRALPENFDIRAHEDVFFRKDGSSFPVQCAASPIFKHGRPVSTVVEIRDMTAAKAAEAALRESEAKFRTITEAMPQMVWSTQADGTADYFNQRWYEFTGVPAGSTHGEAWRMLVHPDDQERLSQAWGRSLATGAPYEIEYRLRHHSGQYRWALGRALPMRDDQGRVLRWMGSSTDIHDHKLREEALASALRSRDEFLSVASHELKTPLSSLKLQTQLFQREVRKHDARVTEERVRKLVDQFERQTNRLTRLVEDMLDIARIQSGKLTIQKEWMSLSDSVREVIDRLEPAMRQAGTPVELVCDEHIDGAWDRFRVEQVVSNLLTNAMRYGDKKPVRVVLERAGERVRLSVEDHGRGIAKEDQEKIFRRFERAISANDVSGLGLGLFISREIVESHGGRIWVESDGRGSGSRFHVELPLGAQQPLIPEGDAAGASGA